MILNGWKEISSHLQRGVRSVQRWECLGLPVMRINNTPRSPVIARSEDLDRWLTRQSKVDLLFDLLLTKFAETQQLHKQAAATRRRSAELIQASEQLRKSC